jgi:2-oxoglutarate ferredoxin oxidoreductase subunit beta
MEFFEFYRKERWPHQFCPGCGLGTIMNTIYKAFNDSNISLDNTVFISGIGCTGRVPGYINADSLHTTHGRALAFATGVKLANPALNVVVISGDGDLFSIGGNHMIHAARRNLDIMVIAVNNGNFGLTGGQVAPTTPHLMRSTTTPEGNPDFPFALAEIVAAAGANYVARWSTAQPYQIVNSIKTAFKVKGFSFIEILSQCPVNFGRRNNMADPVKNFRWIRDNMVSIKQLGKDMDKIYTVMDLNIEGVYTFGELVKRNRVPLGAKVSVEEEEYPKQNLEILDSKNGKK